MPFTALALTNEDEVILRQNNCSEEVIGLMKKSAIQRLLATIILDFKLVDDCYMVGCPEDDSTTHFVGILLTMFFALKVMNPIRVQEGIECRTDTQLPHIAQPGLASNDQISNSLFTSKDRHFFFTPQTTAYQQSFNDLQHALHS